MASSGQRSTSVPAIADMGATTKRLFLVRINSCQARNQRGPASAFDSWQGRSPRFSQVVAAWAGCRDPCVEFRGTCVAGSNDLAGLFPTPCGREGGVHEESQTGQRSRKILQPATWQKSSGGNSARLDPPRVQLRVCRAIDCVACAGIASPCSIGTLFEFTPRFGPDYSRFTTSGVDGLRGFEAICVP